jgi:hypothetical protein
VGGQEHILHCAGGAAEFVDPGNLASRFKMGGNSNNSSGLIQVFPKFGTLFRADFGGWSDLVIKGLEGVGEASAGFARKDMKAPRLGETVGGCPMSVLKDLKQKIASDFAAAIHQSRLDTTPCAIGKLRTHEKSGMVRAPEGSRSSLSSARQRLSQMNVGTARYKLTCGFQTDAFLGACDECDSFVAHNVYRNLTRQAQIDCAFFTPAAPPMPRAALLVTLIREAKSRRACGIEDRDLEPDCDERRSLLMVIDQPFRLLRRRSC